MKGDLTMAQLSKALFSSTKEDWATPQDFFDKLNEEFHFDLDPCADAENAKCKEYFTKEENGLLKDWGGRRVFCNPPYGRKTTGEWIRKCYEEAKKPGTVVVALIPARTDTRFFHDYIYHNGQTVSIRRRSGERHATHITGSSAAGVNVAWPKFWPEREGLKTSTPE